MILMHETHGWHRYSAGDAGIWFKGYLHNAAIEEAGNRLVQAMAKPGADSADSTAAIAAILRNLDGHFALVIDHAGDCLAAVDRVRSIPLFITDTLPDANGAGIASHAPTLARAMPDARLDTNASLALSMAGYTVGNDTLVDGLRQIGPGEFAVSRQGAAWVDGQYDLYAAWQVQDEPDDVLHHRLRETTLAIIRKMAESANGRTFVVPLSAGLDSRLIVSALKHIGYENVKCFSYGISGNYETEASKRIAEALGYPWQKWRYTPKGQAAFFKGALHQDYLAYCDSLCSVPFVQDLAAISGLKESGFIPDDAILVNGNSGDYISGGHIPKPLIASINPGDEAEKRKQTILSVLVGKHFRLWQDLATAENDQVISDALQDILTRKSIDMPQDGNDHGVYEFLEFYTRQCRYVITGQRIYEFLGHEWRLPLWDGDYLDFWQGVPLAQKAGQRLYRDMLEQANWGGVWGEDWTYKHRVSPDWMRCLVRPPLKALHAPFGAQRWHRFEKRYLDYWMDMWAAVSVVSPVTTWRDRRGARSFVSWHNDAYLSAKGLDHSGRETASGFRP